MKRRKFLTNATIATLVSRYVNGKTINGPLKVFVCAGQSNMVGKRSSIDELPESLKQKQENLFFDGTSWVALEPGVTEEKGYGPEISFAAAMGKKLGEPIGIIKHSVGGTNLDKQWSPEIKDSLYHKLLTKVTDAQKSKSIEIVGMIWMQGESDAKSEDMAGRYADNLSAFIQRARTDFKSPKMHFIAGRINSPAPKYGFTDIVRKAQENCPLPGYAFIDLDALEKGQDNLHYTSVGEVQMGNLFAEKMTELLHGCGI